MLTTTTTRIWITLFASSLLVGCSSNKQTQHQPLRITVTPPAIEVLKQVADQAPADFTNPPEFNWGEGVLMAGMMQAGKVCNEAKYIDYVRTWADHHRKELTATLNHKAYCGRWGPAYPVALLYRVTNEEQHLAMVDEVVRFMQTQATRTTDGGFGHWRDNHQLWVDTLFMTCPVFSEMSDIMNRPDYLDEAAQQLIVSANHLQDAQTGLFYHMYDEPEDTRTEEYWGRGNGWTAMAYISVLRYLPKDHDDYARISSDFVRLANGLIAMQDAQTGMYHTVLNRPDSYEETSATAMILYSLVEGHRFGLIEIKDPAFIQRSWSALVKQVEADGGVVGTSTGTGPTDFATYNAIPRGTETWGTGAFLLAASTLAELSE